MRLRRVVCSPTIHDVPTGHITKRLPWQGSCFTRARTFLPRPRMYTYAYQARDNHGKITAGIQDALNEENAITSLMSRGLKIGRAHV